MTLGRAFDALVAILAGLACVLVVGGLFDVMLPVAREVTRAAPPPAEVAERDASVQVVVSAASGDDAGAAGPPIEGAAIRVFWTYRGRHYLAATAKTDVDGRARLSELPRGSSWVLAEAEGYSRTSTQLVLGAEPRTAQVVLPEARELAVTVVDEEGAPIPMATVLATGGDPLPFGALTDPAGVARFDRLGPPPWTLKASARGYESLTRSGVTEDATFALRRLGSLEVLVENADGSPAPDAEVTIAGSSLWPARLATADREGVARIAGLLAGAYDLRATHGELVSETLLGVELDRGEQKRVTLTLVPGRMVTALVTDGEGDSPVVVPSADVVLVEGGLSSFPMLGRTGADGTVTLGPLPRGPATLAARARGFVPRAAVPVPSELDGPVRIPLLRGGTVLGEVVDSKGNPVDGASVEIVGTDIDGLPVSETPLLISFREQHFEWAMSGPAPLVPAGELGVMPGPIPPIPRGPSAPVVGDPSSPLGAQVGAGTFPTQVEPLDPWVTRYDGRFTAKPVTPGRVRALVRHPAYVEGLSDAVTLGPGGEATVRIVLLAGGSLEGRVVDESGQAVGGARVDLTAVSGTLERTTITAADGTFAFASVPEEVVVAVARPDELDRIVLRTTVEVEEGGKEVVELTLPAPRESVRITVKDDSGAPVDTAQVSVTSLDPSAPLRRTFFTGSEGVVSIADAQGLALRVVIEAPGWARQIESFAEAPREIAVELRAGVIVAGEVTAVRGRQFVSGASVTLVQGGARQHAMTDREGRFRFRDVSPGAARIVVSHPDYAEQQTTIEVERTGRADRELEIAAIDLSEPGIVEGDVVDESGQPVVGARVALGVAPAYLPIGALPAGIAVTDSRGRFRLRGVRSGAVDLEAYAADVGRGQASVRVRSGSVTEGIRIRLEGGTGESEPATSGSVAVTLGERGEGGGARNSRRARRARQRRRERGACRGRRDPRRRRRRPREHGRRPSPPERPRRLGRGGHRLPRRHGGHPPHPPRTRASVRVQAHQPTTTRPPHDAAFQQARERPRARGERSKARRGCSGACPRGGLRRGWAGGNISIQRCWRAWRRRLPRAWRRPWPWR